MSTPDIGSQLEQAFTPATRYQPLVVGLSGCTCCNSIEYACKKAAAVTALRYV